MSKMIFGNGCPERSVAFVPFRTVTRPSVRITSTRSPIANPARITLDRYQSVVDGVAIVRTAEASGKNCLDPGGDKDCGGDLHRRTATEVRSRNDQIIGLHGPREIRVDGFQEIMLEDLGIQGVPFSG